MWWNIDLQLVEWHLCHGLRGSVSLSLALSNFEEGGRNPATHKKTTNVADCFTAYVRFITSSLFILHTATGNRNIVQSNCRRPGDQDFTTLYAGPHGKCSLPSGKTLPLLSTGAAIINENQKFLNVALICYLFLELFVLCNHLLTLHFNIQCPLSFQDNLIVI